MWVASWAKQSSRPMDPAGAKGRRLSCGWPGVLLEALGVLHLPSWGLIRSP